MEPQTLLFIIVGISVLGYFFDQVLEVINLRAQRKDIPDDIATFFDRDKYLKSLAYQGDLTRFSFITAAVTFIVSVSMLWFGGFGLLDQWLQSEIANPVIRALVFFGILMLAGDILMIPFQLYGTFVIEQRYGFNKTTIRIFVTDKLKGWLIGAVIGGVLLAALLYLIQLIGENFWIWFALITAVFMLLLNMFYTSWILPLFNRLTPLPEGALKMEIENFARKVNFPLDNVYVIDGSRRSSKANAFFSGIGKKKKIVLYDTLINNHTTEELVAVLAHEVGHYKKKHIVQSYALSVVQVAVTLFILSTMIFNKNLSVALGGSQLSIPLNLVAFGILYSPISAITGLLMSLLSRKNEFEADAYARDTFDGAALSAALKKLSVNSLSNLYPHPWYVFFHYSHPPLLKRLEALSRNQ